jgi:hypothetical protein
MILGVAINILLPDGISAKSMSIRLIFGSLFSFNLSSQLFFVAIYFICTYKIQNNLKKFTSPNTLVGREKDIISCGLSAT